MVLLPRDEDNAPVDSAINPSGVMTPLHEDSSGNLEVTVAGGGTSGTQYTDGIATPANPVGNALEFDNGGTEVDVGNDHPLPIVGSIQQTDLTATGTINAAQPSIGTPVAGATLPLTIGQGQSSWEAQLIPGGGGFTNLSTIVVDVSVDNGATWFTSNFKVSGSLTNSPVQSVVGTGGNLKIAGNAGAKSQVRVRCSVLNAGESVVVTMRSGAGVTDIGLISSIPTGKNTIGNMSALMGAIALTSPPATTNAGSDTPLTFSSQVNHIEVQNNTTATVYVEFDAAATLGSTALLPGAVWEKDLQVSVLHLYTAAAQNINGSAVGGIVVRGWL